MRGIYVTILMFFVWRIFLLIPLSAGSIYLPFNQANSDVQIWAYTRPYPPVDSPLLAPWANFDGVHYLTVAGDGYRRGAIARFLPLYPLMIAFVTAMAGGPIYGVTQFFAALFVSNIAILLALLVLYKLLRMDYSEHTALWSIVFLLLFPTSFFYGAVYTESTFLLLSLLSLYFLRVKKHLPAYFFGSLLCIVRPVGVAILVPFVYEFLMSHRKEGMTLQTLKKAIPMLLVPLWLGLFMVYEFMRFGDPIFFIHAQQGITSGRSRLILFIPQTMYRYIKILTGVSPSVFEWWIALLEFVSFIAVGYLLYKAWKTGVHHSYVIFSLSAFLIPSISGTFSGLPRYVAVLFPIYIVLGLLNKTPLKISLCILFALILFLLTMYFSRGYFIA